VFQGEAAQGLVLRDDASGLAAVRTVAFALDGVALPPLAPPPPYPAGGPEGGWLDLPQE
jgi:hypothetical protein